MRRRAGARAYLVYVKLEGRWRPVSTVRAASDAEARRKAIASLAPEHYDKPIKVERAKPPPPKGRGK
jgi:hypothetical protein